MRNGLKYEKNNKFGVVNYGSGLENGLLAIVFVIASLSSKEVTLLNVETMSDETISEVLPKWLEFEEFAQNKPHNKDYFRRIEDPITGRETVQIDFFGYYRGETLKVDLEKFFQLNKK